MAKEIVIIGGGPGGYVAAIRAAQLGARVTLVERDRVGGTCLNRGCIPTKTLVSAAHILDQAQKASAYGIHLGEARVDFAALMRKKDQVTDKLVSGINHLMKKNRIQLVQGTGRLEAPDRVAVENGDGTTRLKCDGVILATGTGPALIAALGYDGERVLTSNEVLALSTCPASLVIIGGGVIGCEFACVFAALGAQVTIVELLPGILPPADRDVARQMQAALRRRGITVKTGVKIDRVEKDANEVRAVLETGESVAAEKVLISIGRVMNTAGLGLSACGVEQGPRGEILVDDFLATSAPGVWAVGDVTGRIQLAHVASRQGLVAADNIMGGTRAMDYSVVPSCIFTVPEVAAVGLTTQEAQDRGIPFQTGRFPFAASGKAQTMDEGEGFVKVIASPEDRLLGVHIMGPAATELIAEAALAVKMGLSIHDLAETIHAHPTLSETLPEAAEAVHGRSIHAG